jgi:replicative DNA helicase
MDLGSTVLAGIIAHGDYQQGNLPAQIYDLRAECFADPVNAQIWGAISWLLADQVKPDRLTVANALNGRGSSAPKGGWAQYLIRLADMCPSTVNLGTWADELMRLTADMILRRKLEAAMLNDDNLRHAVVKAIDEADSSFCGLRAIRAILPGYMARVEQRKIDPGSILAAATPWRLFNRYLPLERTALTVLAARPSMGKTAFAVNVALHAAKGSKVVFFSLETAADRLLTRVAVVLSGKPREQVLANGNENEFVEAMACAHALDLHIDDRAGIDTGQIAAAVARTGGVDLVVIDYLTRIKRERIQRDDISVGDVMKDLIRIARNSKCHVLLLAQLNRANEARADKRPQLSDLRNSGEIEQDADAVVMLHREAYYNPDCGHNDTEVLIMKNRDGITGMIPFTWNPPLQRFKERSG